MSTWLSPHIRQSLLKYHNCSPTWATRWRQYWFRQTRASGEVEAMGTTDVGFHLNLPPGDKFRSSSTLTNIFSDPWCLLGTSSGCQRFHIDPSSLPSAPINKDGRSGKRQNCLVDNVQYPPCYSSTVFSHHWRLIPLFWDCSRTGFVLGGLLLSETGNLSSPDKALGNGCEGFQVLKDNQSRHYWMISSFVL